MIADQAARPDLLDLGPSRLAGGAFVVMCSCSGFPLVALRLQADAAHPRPSIDRRAQTPNDAGKYVTTLSGAVTPEVKLACHATRAVMMRHVAFGSALCPHPIAAAIIMRPADRLGGSRFSEGQPGVSAADGTGWGDGAHDAELVELIGELLGIADDVAVAAAEIQVERDQLELAVLIGQRYGPGQVWDRSVDGREVGVEMVRPFGIVGHGEPHNGARRDSTGQRPST